MPNRNPPNMSDRYITRGEAEEIATKAAEAGANLALKRTFALLGVDLDEFESVQDLRGNLQWAASGRRVSRALGSKAGSSVIGVVTIGLLVALGDWVRTAITHLLK